MMKAVIIRILAVMSVMFFCTAHDCPVYSSKLLYASPSAGNDVHRDTIVPDADGSDSKNNEKPDEEAFDYHEDESFEYDENLEDIPDDYYDDEEELQ